MKVSELARDLAVPPSVVLEQCHRLGIDAAWAEAELSPTDVVLLQAELAGVSVPSSGGPSTVDPELAVVAESRHGSGSLAGSVAPAEPDGPVADEPPVDEPVVDEAVVDESASAATSGGAPPTSDPAAVSPAAVGSLPELADELMEASAAPEPARRPPTFAGGGPGVPSVAAELVEPRKTANPSRRFDPSLRPGVIALVVAAAALVGGELLDDAPALVAALWLIGLVALVAAALAGNRSRYRIMTHPDQRRGLPIALAVLAVAVVGLVGLGTAVWTVTRAEPAADAPLGLGDLDSVQELRWGYQRVQVIADTGWERPAKDAGTCWEAPDDGGDARREERIELGGSRVGCQDPHAFEVLAVHAVDRDADSPYPDDIASPARCEGARSALGTDASGVTIEVEYPTETGWERGDHDVACVAAALRNRPLG